MFAIDKGLAFSLTIEGVAKPLDQADVVQAVLVESAAMTVPILRLELKDTTGGLSTAPLHDGTRIFVQLGRPDAKVPLAKMPFRVVRVPQLAGASAAQGVQVYCAYDSFAYLTGLVRKPYKGTVSEIFAQISNDTGLNGVSGVQTNDSQWWLPTHERMSAFVRRMVAHAYVDDKSCLIHAHSAAGILFLRNLTTAFDAKPVLKLCEVRQDASSDPRRAKDPPEVLLTGYSMDTHSGMLNMRAGGYGSKTYQEMLSGEGDLFGPVVASRQSNVFAINAEVKDLLADGVRTLPAPIDCGNTHANYIKARHQNERRRALYSTFMDASLDDYTTADIFDSVDVAVQDRVTRGIQTAYSQKYLIFARTRAIQGTRYYERMRLIAPGFADDPAGVCL